MRTLKRFLQRYNPRRKFIDLDEELVIIMAQLGYVEMYRGEWIFTEYGTQEIMNVINRKKRV